MKKFIVYTDGGSRGNPGPSAAGVVLADEKGRVLKKWSQALGVATNNQAEYQAVIFALKKLKSLIGSKNAVNTEVEFRSDSELLVNQVQGRYKILDEKIQPLFIAVWNLKLDYKKVEFVSLSRGENKEADSLVNEALDQERREQKKLL